MDHRLAENSSETTAIEVAARSSSAAKFIDPDKTAKGETRASVPLTRLETHRASLEDVFVALTGRRIEDG